MLILISPAKKLAKFEDIEQKASDLSYTLPALRDTSWQLVDELKGYSQRRIQSLMGLSDNLSALNFERYQIFNEKFSLENAKQAILLFQGDVYQGLDAESFSDEDFMYAQDHLRVLSGLYGVLRPLDLTQPYRLEMGTKLKGPWGKDLYSLWQDIISHELNNAITMEDERYVLNLASNEYFAAVKPASLNAPVITISFKERKGKTYRVVGLMAKKARGKMSRFIIQNRIERLVHLKQYNEDGYQYNADLSDDQNLVFTRD